MNTITITMGLWIPVYTGKTGGSYVDGLMSPHPIRLRIGFPLKGGMMQKLLTDSSTDSSIELPGGNV